LLISTVPPGAADFYAERAIDPRARPAPCSTWWTTRGARPYHAR